MEKYLGSNELLNAADVMNEETFNYIAENTEGMVGRDLSYLALGIEKAALASAEAVVTKALIQKVVAESMAAYNQAEKFESYA